MALKWKGGLVAAAALAVIAVAAVSLAQTPAPAPTAAPPLPGPAAPPPSPPVDPLVEQGKYVAVLGDCAACHTVAGGPALAGGFGLNTPFGTIYSPNITPDKETGIGGWTKAQFERAMRKGKDEKGHNLYPALPYVYYTRMTTVDIDALYAYLMAQPAVKNTPPKNGLGFPFNIRALLTPWNWLHFRSGEYKADAGQSAEWNRGKYLFDGAGHCGGCHTPKNMMGGDKRGQAFRGGLLDEWWAPDLTGNKVTGLGAWSKDDIVEFLKAGSNAHSSVYGSMAEVVQNSTSQMTDPDLAALATYIKSIPASPAVSAKTADAAQIAAGKVVYDKSCTSCHGAAGAGEERVYPKLAGAAGVNAPKTEGIVHMILSGNLPGPTTTIQSPDPMPPFAVKLSDKDVAAVATYIRNSWGNKAGPVSEKDVAKVRAKVVKPVAKVAG
ncbi:cytochrome c [soil metagenome]